VDGVLVGIGTILKDDPMLTARVKEPVTPPDHLGQPIEGPEGAKIFDRLPSRVIIATTHRGSQEKMERSKKGCSIRPP